MIQYRLLSLLSLLSAIVTIAAAIARADTGNQGAWGDQGDGTFLNPILPGDFSDIDAIRVGDDYYAISSTLHLSPGMAILHSKDLVNWRILGHAVDDLARIGPEMNWDRMNRYGRGVWAGALRHHAGRFWLYFGTPDEGFFMTTAKDPAGPWEPLHQVWAVKGWDDCCPFWDDDGQGYFVCTNFADKYKIHLFKMSEDGRRLLPESDRVIHQSAGSEASKLYKIGGWYYHFFSEVRKEGRVCMMNRAKSLAGPWETRQLNHVNKAVDREPNQGGLIQVPSGGWWFLTHQGHGGWEGRPLCLLPVTWADGWPIIGKPGADGVGTMVWKEKKPIAGFPILPPQTSDEFDAKSLGVQWEWNHQPRAEKWSLSQRPGFLRLHAFKPLKKGDLLRAGNTLSQRSLRAQNNQVIVKLDLAGMADGQQAGLCHFARTYGTLGVIQSGPKRTLVFSDNGKSTTGPAIAGDALWLMSTWDQDGVSRYAYSLDGERFTALGQPYQLTWGHYRGDRVGVYCFNDESDAGHVDVDWFRYSFTLPQPR